MRGGILPLPPFLFLCLCSSISDPPFFLSLFFFFTFLWHLVVVPRPIISRLVSCIFDRWHVVRVYICQRLTHSHGSPICRLLNPNYESWVMDTIGSSSSMIRMYLMTQRQQRHMLRKMVCMMIICQTFTSL